MKTKKVSFDNKAKVQTQNPKKSVRGGQQKADNRKNSKRETQA